MGKDKSLYVRIDVLTEMLIADLMEQEKLNKSEVVRKAIYELAMANLPADHFASLVQLSVDFDRL